VNNSKYYELLELTSSASSNDLRKAYKKLLLKHHPDKGGDPKKFQELQNVYEVLSDPDRKELYDKYGEDGLKSHTTTENKQKPKAASILYTIRIQLEEVYTGVTKELEITRERMCKKCNGLGAKTGCIRYTCEGCNGKGIQAYLTKTNIGMIQQTLPCTICEGLGTCISENDKCEDCKGKKKIEEKKTLIIEVEKGTPDGFKYRFPGEGNESKGFDVGDVHVEVFLENKTKFERRGADLATTVDISVVESFTPFEITLTHLDGRKIYLQNPQGQIIQPGMVQTIKDGGMPFHVQNFKYGNLYVSFNIIIPQVSEEAQSALLEVSIVLLYSIQY
jgi:DnaJ homolog subfamily A member 2